MLGLEISLLGVFEIDLGELLSLGLAGGSGGWVVLLAVGLPFGGHV